ncbi:MAG: outer membrane lipoprotein carrier protein LolA [Candidatus Velthaea sp.]
MYRFLSRLCIVGAAALVVFVHQPAGAASAGAQALMAQLSAADPSLQTYRANVEFSVGLKTFPYLHKTLHGETFFKRPSRLEIVFSDLPGFAQSFKNLYVGLGTPADWEKKFEIDVAQEALPDGKSLPYLVLTPRKPDRRLQHVDVFIDLVSSLPNRIVWRYRDGVIQMRQDIVEFNGHSVISAQNADIRLPGVHAYVNAKMANYAINVPVDDAVFTKKPPQP